MSVLFDGNFPAFDIIGGILARDKTTSSLLPTSVPFAVSTTSADGVCPLIQSYRVFGTHVIHRASFARP